MSNCACKISDDGTKLLSACGLHYAWARQNFAEEAIEECAKLAEQHFIYGHSVAGPAFAKVCADKIRALAAR